MTISIPLVVNVPHIAVFLSLIPVVFLASTLSFLAGGFIANYRNEIAIRKGAASIYESRHIAMAPADVMYRPDAEIAIFKASPWKAPEEDLMAA